MKTFIKKNQITQNYNNIFLSLKYYLIDYLINIITIVYLIKSLLYCFNYK